MLQKEDIYKLLDNCGISYQAFDHPAVYTMEEMYAMDMPGKGQVLKNLFLRDDKKRNYYLVSLPGDKGINMKDLSDKIPSRKLSFASEADLGRCLCLEKGEVTPLGALNSRDGNVTVVFDNSLRGQPVGIHPLTNMATVFIAFDDLLQLLQEQGCNVIVCNL